MTEWERKKKRKNARCGTVIRCMDGDEDKKRRRNEGNAKEK